MTFVKNDDAWDVTGALELQQGQERDTQTGFQCVILPSTQP